jgi:hypothetical protein
MARLHHYNFAHVALRQLFLHNPGFLIGALKDRGDYLLKKLWDEVGSRIEEDGEAVRLLPDTLGCEIHEIESNIVIVIVTLPPPEEIPEAYFVGLIFRPEYEATNELLEAQTGIVHYVTLERGIDLAKGKVRTVLCEWTTEAHLNRGTGPDATVKEFMAVLQEMVN